MAILNPPNCLIPDPRAKNFTIYEESFMNIITLINNAFRVSQLYMAFEFSRYGHIDPIPRPESLAHGQ